ncbi:MAG: glycosyltransferase [Verrucomicrobiota bacterium]|nr:glycosyltransferase [Verrucomicrobiota bacterium]
MKILILHASAGAGHKRAAEAIATAIKSAHPECVFEVRDILDFTSSLFKRTYGQGYLDLVRTAPELWGYMYSLSDKNTSGKHEKKIRALFNKLSTLPFKKFLNEFQPDAVICTHFMPLEILSTLKTKGGSNAKIHCVITDFAVHALWLVDNVDHFYVCNEDARRFLIRKGYAPEKVHVTGIPIDPVFAQKITSAMARKKIGLDPNTPTALLMTGGFGVGPSAELLGSFKETETKCQIIMVAGKNEDLKKKADASAKAMKIPVKVFGFVSNIHELMDAADVVITKPGGLTTSEVLAKGKPMIIIDPIPGQEQRNCEFLLENGAALRLHEVEDAAYKVGALLSNTTRLNAMKKSSLTLAKPQAAADIVNIVFQDI